MFIYFSKFLLNLYYALRKPPVRLRANENKYYFKSEIKEKFENLGAPQIILQRKAIKMLNFEFQIESRYFALLASNTIVFALLMLLNLFLEKFLLFKKMYCSAI